MTANKITGANAGGASPSRIRVCWAARIAQSVVKRHMRAARVIPAIVLIVLLSAVVLFVLFDTKFRRFKHQSAMYHAEVAAACDFMLAHYPIGTNSYGVEISVTDAALPQVVRSLHPIKIKLAPNWAW